MSSWTHVPNPTFDEDYRTITCEEDGVGENIPFRRFRREYAPTDEREWPHYVIEVRLFEQDSWAFNDEKLVVIFSSLEGPSDGEFSGDLQFHPASLTGAVLATLRAAQEAFGVELDIGVEPVTSGSAGPL